MKSNIETFTTQILDTMPPAEASQLPAEILLKLQNEVEREGDIAKSHARMLGVVFAMRYSGPEQQQRSVQAKPTGRVRLEDDGIMVVANAIKKVEWNREILSEALGRMLPDVAQRYGKWSVVVEERLFNEAPAVIKAAFEPARTVSVSKSTYRLEAKDSNPEEESA